MTCSRPEMILQPRCHIAKWSSMSHFDEPSAALHLPPTVSAPRNEEGLRPISKSLSANYRRASPRSHIFPACQMDGRLVDCSTPRPVVIPAVKRMLLGTGLLPLIQDLVESNCLPLPGFQETLVASLMRLVNRKTLI